MKYPAKMISLRGTSLSASHAHVAPVPVVLVLLCAVAEVVRGGGVDRRRVVAVHFLPLEQPLLDGVLAAVQACSVVLIPLRLQFAGHRHGAPAPAVRVLVRFGLALHLVGCVNRPYADAAHFLPMAQAVQYDTLALVLSQSPLRFAGYRRGAPAPAVRMLIRPATGMSLTEYAVHLYAVAEILACGAIGWIAPAAHDLKNSQILYGHGAEILCTGAEQLHA